MKKRAAIYARVSSDEQRGNYSIPTQVEECLNYAEAKKYSIVGNQFVDPETGFDIQNQDGAIRAFVDDFTSRELSRPSLDNALRYLESTGFDVLIVIALDRLARDPYIRRTLELEFEERGAFVEYVQGNYEQSPEGEVRKDLDATFAKWENTKRVERSKRGKRGKAKRGLFVAGRPPFGYKIDREAKGGLAVDDQQATIVRWIFELYVIEKLSVREITRKLTSEKVLNHSGNTKWGTTSITRILQNTTYIGRCFYNKYKRVKNGRQLEKRDSEEWIEFETTPIVDEALFYAAQDILKANRQRRRREGKRFYLLSGMIECAECRRAYVGNAKKAGTRRLKNDALSYRHRKKEGHCKNRMISARIIESYVWDEIVTLLLEPEKLREGYQASLEQQKANQARQRARLEILHKKLINLEQQLQNLTVVYIDPDIGMPKPEYLAQRNMINTEVKDINEQIKSLQTELEGNHDPAELEVIEDFSTEIRKRLEGNIEPPPKVKRQLLEMLHVTVFLGENDDIRIEGWFNKPDGKDGGLLSKTY